MLCMSLCTPHVKCLLYKCSFTREYCGKKKYKNSLKKVNEALEAKDLEIIKKLIRNVIGDVYRDIWIKRASWK